MDSYNLGINTCEMGKKGKLQLVMRILFDHIAGLCQFNHDGAGIGVAVKPKHGGKLAAIHNHIFCRQVGQSEGTSAMQRLHRQTWNMST